jgi:acyl-CoA thioesterase-1
MPLRHNKNSRFLFIGDDITHGGRSTDPENLGHGYVRMVRDYLFARHSTTAPRILNHGEPGLRLSDWLERWPVQALAARPELVSVAIDVPEPAGGPGSKEHEHALNEFRAVYRQLLIRTRELSPECNLVLCEPAALWSNLAYEADNRLRPFVHALFKIGEEFHAHGIIPVHSALVHARRSRPDITWLSADGLPTSTAHAVIAYTWLEEEGLAPLATS